MYIVFALTDAAVRSFGQSLTTVGGSSAVWSRLAQIGEHAQENVVWLVLAVALPPIIIWLLWRWLPKRVQRALKWLDDMIPGDFSALHRPVSFLIVSALSIIVLIPAVIAVTWSLGGDIDKPQELFADFGRAAGEWARDKGVKILIALFLAFVAQRFASRAIPRAIEGYIRRRAQIEPGVTEAEVQKRINTLSGVLARSVALFIFVAAIFMVLAQLGMNMAPLLAAAGVAGIAIGFGAQTIIRDILAGIFVILEDQFRVGDVVTVAGVSGVVEDINLRRTVLRDLDYQQHFVPNGEIRVATNMTKGKSRVNLNIGVAYKEDLDRVIQVLNDIGREMASDPRWGPLLLDPPKVLRVENLGDSAIELKVLGETLPMRQWDVAGEYRLRVKKTFDRLGIEIPFPHRTIYWGAGEPKPPLLNQTQEQLRQEARDTAAPVDGPPQSDKTVRLPDAEEGE